MNKHIVETEDAAYAFNQLFNSVDLESKCFSLKNCHLKCTCREPHLCHEDDCPEHGKKREYNVPEDYELNCTCREPHLFEEPDCPRHCK